MKDFSQFSASLFSDGAEFRRTSFGVVRRNLNLNRRNRRRQSGRNDGAPQLVARRKASSSCDEFFARRAGRAVSACRWLSRADRGPLRTYGIPDKLARPFKTRSPTPTSARGRDEKAQSAEAASSRRSSGKTLVARSPSLSPLTLSRIAPVLHYLAARKLRGAPPA